MQKAIGIKKILKPKTKIKKIIFPIVLGIFIFLILIVVGTWVYIESYQNKIYPGVSVSSFGVGGYDKVKTLDVIQKRIDKLNEVGLVLKGTNEGEKIISYEDLGIKFNKDATYEATYDYGRNKVNKLSEVNDIYKSLFREVSIPLVLDYDNEKFESKLNELMSNQIKESKDAAFGVEGSEVKIIPETNGVEINFSFLRKDIDNLASSENIYKKIDIQTKDKNANITTADLKKVQGEIESYLDNKIVYKNNYLEYVPTKEDVVGWFKLEKKSAPKLIISDEGIKDYIGVLASKIDKKEIDTKVNAETGEVITEGSDGVVLDQEKALLDTKSALNSEKAESIINLKTKVQKKQEVKVKPTPQAVSGGTPGMAGGKYLEVNLANQTMYLYEGDNEVAAYSVSTGKWDMPTPVGTRTISGKTANAWSEKYGLYMPYWNDIGSGYGIHELPEWPGGYKEGESHLGTPVSHGCIRLGVGAAEHVYSWAPIGTQVFIHY